MNSLFISKKYIIRTEQIQNTESKTQDQDSLKKRLALHKIDRLLTVGFSGCELYLFLLGLARMYTPKTEDYNQEVIPRIP